MVPAEGDARVSYRALPRGHVFPIQRSSIRRDSRLLARLAATIALAGVIACAGFPDSAPVTQVVLENHYEASAANALTIFDAYWLNVSFSGRPIAAGAASDPLGAIPASADNRAYVVLAPGWDPTSTTPPSQLVVLQSRAGYEVALGDTVHIAVDDTAFEGNCAAGSPLTRDAADFLTQIVFASDFAGLHYDAATCTTTSTGDAGAP